MVASSARAVDAEVARLLREAEERALVLLRDHRQELERLTALLLEHDTVEGEAVYEIVGRPAPRGQAELAVLASRDLSPSSPQA